MSTSEQPPERATTPRGSASPEAKVRHHPLGRLLWFAVIWCVSVGVLACVAALIRWAIVP
ncbi:hypothetical protein VWZ88_14025 [Phaeobacter sp. JH20_36]|uniref:hypothetical protein n=1 Tax=unclassified Phaeobacter TaxID=2621772 RepID=UPI003A86136A